MSEWVQVATREDFGAGSCHVITQETTNIALFLVEEDVFAIEAACPHMLAPFSDGELDGAVIICPWHKARYSLRTGSCLGPQSYDSARVYSVRWEGDNVLLEWPPGQGKLVIR